jgi:hypothetical protein
MSANQPDDIAARLTALKCEVAVLSGKRAKPEALTPDMLPKARPGAETAVGDGPRQQRPLGVLPILPPGDAQRTVARLRWPGWRHFDAAARWLGVPMNVIGLRGRPQRGLL